MRTSKVVLVARGLIAAALLAVGLTAPPQALAQNRLVEVYFCVVDGSGHTWANIPVQLEYKGVDGNWYRQRTGTSRSGCTSFYNEPAPRFYRVTSNSTCVGSTQEAYVPPGPQFNIGNLLRQCMITTGPTPPAPPIIDLGPPRTYTPSPPRPYDPDGDSRYGQGDMYPADPYSY
jgi:hypothetical protein